MCKFKKKYLKWVFTALIFLFAAEVNAYLQKVGKGHCQCHGLERGCDLVPHINTPLCISSVFSVNSKPKINPCEETSHIINFHE